MNRHSIRFVLAMALSGALAAMAGDSPVNLPYQDDAAIVKLLQDLPEGGSALLPGLKHMLDGKPVASDGRNGPYARDYTNRMAYAPERQTAFYAGGNHGMGRTNDVWEYHLGSNTWQCLFAAEGGDHARFKYTLMFASRIFGKNPDYVMKPDEQKNFDDCKQWWKDNVVLKDGMYLTKGGGPLLVGHTWDTLVYDPIKRRMIQGTGAYCASQAWLESKFSGTPIEEVQAKLGKDPQGRPYRTMWTFDPETKKWAPYASESPLAVLAGMGATMCYIPDWKKIVFFYSGQNSPGAALTMRAYDPEKDVWEELKPNGGKPIADLAYKSKVAPSSEQQTAYSSKHRKLVAVLDTSTFAYDIEKNEWSKLNDGIPFKASDSSTVFAYDTVADAFLLCAPRTGAVAAFSLEKNEWTTVTPSGPGLPKPPYGVGKGYYDPTHNVFVVQCAYTQQMWVYRHKKGSAK